MGMIRSREGRRSRLIRALSLCSSSAGNLINGNGDEKDQATPRWPPQEMRWRRKLGSALFSGSAWRKRLGVLRAVLRTVGFRAMYVLEALVLSALVCFYFCRFGCRV